MFAVSSLDQNLEEKGTDSLDKTESKKFLQSQETWSLHHRAKSHTPQALQMALLTALARFPPQFYLGMIMPVLG